MPRWLRSLAAILAVTVAVTLPVGYVGQVRVILIRRGEDPGSRCVQVTAGVGRGQVHVSFVRFMAFFGRVTTSDELPGLHAHVTCRRGGRLTAPAVLWQATWVGAAVVGPESWYVAAPIWPFALGCVTPMVVSAVRRRRRATRAAGFPVTSA